MLGWGCHLLEFVETVVVPFADGVAAAAGVAAVAAVVAFVTVVAVGVAVVVAAVVIVVAVAAVAVIAAVVANEPIVVVVADAVAESSVVGPSEIETVANYFECWVKDLSSSGLALPQADLLGQRPACYSVSD